MQLIPIFLEQLDREAELTRRALKNLPEGKQEWKPHPKSMPLGYLSFLTASMLSWISLIVKQDELDIAPKDKDKSENAKAAAQPHTSAELIQMLDKAVKDAREALSSATDEDLISTWRLLSGGQVADEKPRYKFIIENFTHLAHHRGQLTVYLRLNDAEVPAIYGPSADDKRF